MLVNPVDQYPAYFGGNAFLIRFPYFLPCAFSSVISLVGAAIGVFFMRETRREKRRVRLPISDAIDFINGEAPNSHVTEEDRPSVATTVRNSTQNPETQPLLARAGSSMLSIMPTFAETIATPRVWSSIMAYSTWCLVNVVYEEVYVYD
jgi:hypothetical protein